MGILFAGRLVLSVLMKKKDTVYTFWTTVYRLQACSRHEGASVVVIKHTKNVAKCAWLGELDSAEESDEISSEFDFQQEVLGDEEEDTNDVTDIPIDDNEDTTEKSVFLSEDSKELHKYLDQIEKWSIKSRKIVVKRLLEQIVGNKHVPEEDLEIFKNVLQDHVKTEEEPPHVSEIHDRFSDDDINEDHGGEIEDPTNVGIDHFLDNGKFNQKNQGSNKKDKSNEEVRSSWSSSGIIHKRLILSIIHPQM